MCISDRLNILDGVTASTSEINTLSGASAAAATGLTGCAIHGRQNSSQPEAGNGSLRLLLGPGAGAEPTATAVLSDIISIVQGKQPNAFGPKTNELNLNVNHGEKESNRYYMRLNVIDKSGVLAGVTEIFRKYALSIESLLQRGRNPNEEVPVVITTHETDYDTLQSVMKDLTNSKELISKPVCMKII